MQNSNCGKEFWIALPQNEDPRASISQEGLEIIVTSYKDTKVTLEYPSTGFVRTKDVIAYQPTVFTSEDSDVQFNWVVTESETVLDKAVHIIADDPVFVFSINVKRWSAEGYTALPIRSWGTEYLHCSYFDDHENNRDRGSGFIIVAAENNTQVNIQLNGAGAGVATTVGGREIGDAFSVKLNKGQTYMVRGDGSTYGQFDLSGSEITASNPIGLISFHMRCPMPSNPARDLYRDNLSEMLPPVSQWGKQHVSVQFSRTKNGSREGDGDNFRAMSGEASNNVSCVYMEKGGGSIIGQPEMKINKKGQFFEPFNIMTIDRRNNKLTSVRGVSHWSGEKPYMLNQYAWSYQWDGDLSWDPLQIVIPPVEQYVSNAIFCTPSSRLSFNDNELNLFVIGDPDDPDKALLKSVKLDGKPIYESTPGIITNRITGTDIYWVKLFVGPGTHSVESNTKFGGYLTGFRAYYSYGWPITMGTNTIDELDEVPPVFEVDEDCGNYFVKVTERTKGEPYPEQEDRGISRVVLIEDSSYNFNFEILNEESFIPQHKITEVNFVLEVIDPMKEAFAVFAALDKAGNYRIDSIRFYPETVVLEPEEVVMQPIRAGTSISDTVKVMNTSDKNLTINGIEMQNGSKFFIKNSQDYVGLAFNSGTDVDIIIDYIAPLEDMKSDDIDTLIVHTVCFEYKYQISASALINNIMVEDFDFGKHEVNTSVCIEDINNDGLKITNSGEWPLLLKSLEGAADPFFVEINSPSLPKVLEPGEEIYFKSICFFPKDSGSFSAELTFTSDAMSGDSVISLTGLAFKVDTTGIIDNPAGSSDISVISMPVYSDILEIGLPEIPAGEINLSIFNINGINTGINRKVMIQDSRQAVNINTGKLPDGVYIIQVSAGSRTYTARFIRLR